MEARQQLQNKKRKRGSSSQFVFDKLDFIPETRKGNLETIHGMKIKSQTLESENIQLWNENRTLKNRIQQLEDKIVQLENGSLTKELEEIGKAFAQLENQGNLSDEWFNETARLIAENMDAQPQDFEQTKPVSLYRR